MEKVKSVLGKVKGFIIRNKKKIIIVAIVLIAVWFLFFRSKGKSDYTVVSKSDTVSLTREDFTSSVSETGKVKSEKSNPIYPEKALPISEINVKVGDVVSEGDVIARLDDSTIRQQIAQTQATIGATSKSAGAQIDSAKTQLDGALKNREKGTDAAISGADSSVDSAYDAWQSAEKTYQDFRKSLDERYNDALIAAESSEETTNSGVQSAELNYTQAQEELRETQDTASKNREWARDEQRTVDRLDDEIKSLGMQAKNTNTGSGNVATGALESDVPTSGTRLTDAQTELTEAKSKLAKYEAAAEAAENSISTYERKVEQMRLALETARKTEETDKNKTERNEKSREDQLETYRKAAESAKNSYDNALKNLEVTRVSSEDQVKALENSLKIAQASGDTSTSQVSLKYLYEDLDKTVIRAPISGTVTAENMELGQTPTGSLCTIETVDDQVIESSVKEFDLNSVKVGMKVIVTSDALGKSKPFEGRVISVDPAPAPAETLPTGTSAGSAKNVTYNTKIKLDTHSEELKPGMTIRAKYILEEQKNVYSIPTTAIYEKNGKDFILAATTNKKGTKLKEIEVITGLENDVEIIIQSDKLKDGMVVITSPDKYSSEQEVEFVDDTQVDI
ncbi:HlyD family secretion protein [Anaerosphaera aminiphila DSM 21120]|uniref:HlyD family secretion protein n=1 Tax=Anaerosphaera aminiphila DSM 21120 TaxID=1120995 RepID=A0A1M5R8T1_9FIRM|nr:HlyD family efflux transporter periplasmic adaptor subunit [Anaerosphaera aminiphila]SHH22754.1 HlyD family secretion protein [Anaerosphaera aminiphila DSM 21120]